MNLRIAASALAAACLLIPVGCAQQPAVPPPAESHPAYLQALGHLRQVRWLLRHGNGSGAPGPHEQVALGEIDAAIAVIRKAAFDDGMDSSSRAPIDVPGKARARLNQAAALLRKINLEVSLERDTTFAHGLRGEVLQHSLSASYAVANAFHDPENAP